MMSLEKELCLMIDYKPYAPTSIFYAWCWLRVIRTGNMPIDFLQADVWGKEEMDRCLEERKATKRRPLLKLVEASNVVALPRPARPSTRAPDIA